MSFFPAPLTVRPGGLLVRATPAARIVGGGLWLVTAALLSGPRGEALLCLAALVVLVSLSGLSLRPLPRRLAPVLAAAAGLGLVAALGNVANGDPLQPAFVALGPLRLTEPGVSAGLALALRITAFALASLLAFGPTDTTRLADALVQQWHVPDRLAYGTVAAIGLAPLVAADWQATGATRRLRGLESGWVGGRLWQIPGRLGVVLVSAFRRADRLALAMDARGFDSGIARSRYRLVRAGWPDAVVVAGALAVAAVVLLVGG